MDLFAHVKWFEDPSRYPLRTDLIFSERTALLLLVGGGAVLLLWLLSRLLNDPHWPRLPFFKQMAEGAPTLLAVQSAVALVHIAVAPSLLAPHLHLPLDPFGLALSAAQFAVAFAFVTGLLDWVAALLLIGLWLVGFTRFSVGDMLDQLYWVGIGLFVLVIGRFASDVSEARAWFKRRDERWSAWPILALRIITGLAIIAPALTEKLWNPDLGLAFLRDHPNFNLFRTAGAAWMTDELFVLSAGLVEGAIGIALISGFLTRVMILGMWLPFNAGLPFLPPEELLGHLPIFGIMYLLLVHSAGVAPGESASSSGPPAAPAPATA